MDPQTAKKMMRDVDAARNRYHKAYIPGWQSVFDHKDLMIDSSRFGIDGTAKILADIVKNQWADGPQIFDLRRQRVIIQVREELLTRLGSLTQKPCHHNHRAGYSGRRW